MGLYVWLTYIACRKFYLIVTMYKLINVKFCVSYSLTVPVTNLRMRVVTVGGIETNKQTNKEESKQTKT